MPPKDKSEEQEDLDIEDGADGETEEGEGEDRGDVVDGKGGGDGDGDEESAVEDGEEEETVGEEEGAGAGKGKSRMVPHGRFNEVNERLKASEEARIRLEERNKLLEEQRTERPPPKEPKAKFDFDAKEEEAANAMIEGDAKKAAGIRREINAAIREEAEESAYSRAVQTSRDDRSKELLEDAAAEMVEDYPFLDEKSKEANTSAIRQVLALRNDFIRTDRMRPDLALRKAAKEIGDLYAARAPAEKEEEEEEENEEGGEEQQGKAKRSKRDELAIARGARAAARQPAPLTGAGARAREGNIDPATLSESEFRNLSDKEKKKLRGDFV